MRPELLLAGLVVGLVVIGASLAGYSATGGDLPLVGTGPGTDGDGPRRLPVEWVSQTARPIGGNHHAVAAGRIGGHPMVFAPISGEDDTTQCALVALDARDGSVEWEDRVPAADCTVHSVADVTLADIDSDAETEVLAATTERAVKAYSARTGEVEFTYPLSSYGYTRPLAADVSGDGRPELIVTDAVGSIFVVRQDRSTLWSRPATTYTWGQPAVEDFDADGEPELAVALGSTAELIVFEAATGRIAWNRSLEVTGSVTWLATGQADADPAVEIAAATTRGEVLLVDGRTGTQQWRRTTSPFAAVNAIGDGDGDGEAEVYAVAKDGKLMSLRAASGELEWTTSLTDADVQMMPPPALGDVDGDGDPELVAVTNDGRVAVVEPRTGRIVAATRRDGRIWTHPTLADTDGDGTSEIYVVYGDGRVVRFSAPVDREVAGMFVDWDTVGQRTAGQPHRPAPTTRA